MYVICTYNAHIPYPKDNVWESNVICEYSQSRQFASLLMSLPIGTRLVLSVPITYTYSYVYIVCIFPSALSLSACRTWCLWHN